MSQKYSSNGLEQATVGGGAADASTEFDSKCGIKRVKLELHNSGDAETGVENITPGPKMLPEIKQEVVQAATTSSSPANGADGFPGSDCDSEPVPDPGLECEDNPSVITDTRRYRCQLCNYSAIKEISLKSHLKCHRVPRLTQTEYVPGQPGLESADKRSFITGMRYKCGLCYFSAKSTSNLKLHMKLHQRPVKSNAVSLPFPCTKWKTTHPENVTPGLKTLPEVKEEVVEAATTSSLSATGADVLPGPDCDSEPVPDPGLECEDKPSVITDTRRYRCGLCYYSAIKEVSLKIHMKCHRVPTTETVSFPYVCDLCPRAFQLHFNWVQHRRAHVIITGKRNCTTFCCAVCRERFTSMTKLKRHKEKHAHRGKIFGCVECPRRFSHPTSLSNHMLQKHTRLYKEIHRCQWCRKKFVSLTCHQKHEDMCRYVEQKTNRKFRCQRCRKVFKSHVWQERHEETCDDSLAARRARKWKFKCEQCGKGFVSFVWHEKHKDTCVVKPPPSETSQRRAQLSRMDDVQFENVSAHVFSAESATGTHYAALDELPSTDPLALDPLALD